VHFVTRQSIRESTSRCYLELSECSSSSYSSRFNVVSQYHTESEQNQCRSLRCRHKIDC